MLMTIIFFFLSFFLLRIQPFECPDCGKSVYNGTIMILYNNTAKPLQGTLFYFILIFSFVCLYLIQFFHHNFENFTTYFQNNIIFLHTSIRKVFVQCCNTKHSHQYDIRVYCYFQTHSTEQMLSLHCKLKRLACSYFTRQFEYLLK